MWDDWELSLTWQDISRWTRARFHTQGNAGQPSDTWLPGTINALLTLAGDDFERHTKVQTHCCKINMEVSKFLLLRISLRMHASLSKINSIHSVNGHTGSGDPDLYYYSSAICYNFMICIASTHVVCVHMRLCEWCTQRAALFVSNSCPRLF